MKPGLSALFSGARVRGFEPEAVTSRSGSLEVAPEQAGLRREQVNVLWRSVVRLYETGLHPAIALCIRRNGQVVLDRAIGHERGNAPDDPPHAPRVQATPRTLFNLCSACKPITAMAVHLLAERGRLRLDDPVAKFVPAFGCHGKHAVTLRHLLTHRAGIPWMPARKLDLELLSRPKDLLDLICRGKPTSIAGQRVAYHALTSGFLLGEVVAQVSGSDLRTFARRELLDPLGLRELDYGVPPERVPQVAQNAFTGFPILPPISGVVTRALGSDFREAVRMTNDPRFLCTTVPSANVIGTASEAARFFEVLLRGGELDGVRLFDRRTVQQAIAPQGRPEVDGVIGLPMRYGMGFMLGGRFLSLYGRDTPRAFGHIGFTNVVLWADPDRAISACLMTTGKPLVSPGHIAWLNVAWTIARVCPKVR